MSQHQPTSPDPVAEAIAALTTAARGRRTIGAGTPDEHIEPVDFADIAAYVLTAVAANLGGIEELLEGRPGSWEADLVRQLVENTVGPEDDDLLAYRTEPIRLPLDAESIFDEFGVAEMAIEDGDEAGRRAHDALDALFDTMGTPEERVRRAELSAELEILWGARPDPETLTALHEELMALDESIVQRAQDAGDPRTVTIADARAAMKAIDRLYKQDQEAYRQAYAAAAREVLTNRGIGVPVQVVGFGPAHARSNPDDWELVQELEKHARQTAPLPMTGQAPDWSQGTPADALRRAGLTYTARIQQSR